MDLNELFNKRKEVDGYFSVFILMFLLTFVPLMLPDRDVLLRKGLLFPVLYLIEFFVIVPLYLLFFMNRAGMGRGKINGKHFAVMLCIILIIQLVLPRLLGMRQSEGWMLAQVSLPGWSLVLNVALLTFIVPIYEEIVFRGCLFGALKYWFGGRTYPAAIVMSLIFTLLHTQYADWRTLFLLFLVSLTLSIARVKSDGLYLPIMLHMAMNGIVTLIFYMAVMLLK